MEKHKSFERMVLEQLDMFMYMQQNDIGPLFLQVIHLTLSSARQCPIGTKKGLWTWREREEFRNWKVAKVK